MAWVREKNRADTLSEQEEEQLWQTGVLGSDNPKSLNYFMLSQQLGTRDCQEHHQLHIEHFKFVSDPKYFINGMGRRSHKTRPGGLSKVDQRLPQKAFTEGGDNANKTANF